MKQIFSSFLFGALVICLSFAGYSQTGVTKYGDHALFSNSGTGIYNSAFGYYSLYSNTTGTKNTATGANVLRFTTTGSYNTGNGYASIYSNTTGDNNSGFGAYTLFTNTTGSFNTATGSYSLRNNTSSYNTATGYEAMFSNKTGSYNTVNGYDALYSSTTGSYNTALGSISSYNNTTGSYNTTVGRYSFYSNTSGNYNTAIGYHALYSNTTGTFNTAIGYSANVASGGLTNATAIGYNASVDNSNKVRVGNTSVTSIGGQVGWTTFSDGKYKKEIKESVAGLSFIKSLRPVTYTVNVKGLQEYFEKGKKISPNDEAEDKHSDAENSEMKKAEDAAAKVVYNGFIAQEVEDAAKKLNYNFSGVDKPQSKDGLYGLRYDNFVVPLVKAVQELASQNEELKKENDDLRKRLDNIEVALSKTTMIEKNVQKELIKTAAVFAKLEQNAPNPFNGSTVIRYQLPASMSSAQIMITNSGGSVVKTYNLTNKGAGQVMINAGEFSAGNYFYTLFVDGKRIDSKQMIVVK